MMQPIELLLTQHPVRKSKVQKEAFRAWFQTWAKEHGWEVRVERARNPVMNHNVVVGDPESAEVVFTAHYDTPAVMPLPNFITPCNMVVYLLYQVVLAVAMMAPGILCGFLAGWLAGRINPDAAFPVGYFTTMALMFLTIGLMMCGPANKHNANDNTSGVAAVMELMLKLPEEQRGKVAFILFDNEEKGMLGSAAYASQHKVVKKEKLLINMDCVGDGETMLFIANKHTRQLPAYARLEAAMQEAAGRTLQMVKMEHSVYPSDQSNYRLGMAVCACNRAKGIGLYCDKIHTKKDTICEQINLDFLAEGLSAFVASL